MASDEVRQLLEQALTRAARELPELITEILEVGAESEGLRVESLLRGLTLNELLGLAITGAIVERVQDALEGR